MPRAGEKALASEQRIPSNRLAFRWVSKIGAKRLSWSLSSGILITPGGVLGGCCGSCALCFFACEISSIAIVDGRGRPVRIDLRRDEDCAAGGLVREGVAESVPASGDVLQAG